MLPSGSTSLNGGCHCWREACARTPCQRRTHACMRTARVRPTAQLLVCVLACFPVRTHALRRHPDTHTRALQRLRMSKWGRAQVGMGASGSGRKGNGRKWGRHAGRRCGGIPTRTPRGWRSRRNASRRSRRRMRPSATTRRARGSLHSAPPAPVAAGCLGLVRSGVRAFVAFCAASIAVTAQS